MIIFREILIYTLSYVGLFSATLLILTFFDNIHKLKHPKIKRYPFVSILVPAFNEERCLAKTLISLLDLDYPKEKIEIIVIDDGSTDNTLAIAQKYQKKGIHVFTKENSGKADTLNFGLEKCRGEIVGALDADSFVDPDALKKMVPYFEKERVMCVVPSVKIWKPSGVLQKIQEMEFLSSAFIRNVFSHLGGVPLAPGPFTLYKKEFFDRYGGYDVSTITEDIEIALRIESKKYIIESVIDASVYTRPISGFIPIYRQRLRWFTGFIDNLWKYKFLIRPSYGNLGVFVLPMSIISILLGIIAFSYSMIKLVEHFIKNMLNLYLINFDISTWFYFDFDLFFFNTGPLFILPVMGIAAAILLIILAKRYSKEKQPIALSMVCFFSFYWAVYSVCWISALSHKLAKKKVTWR